MRNHLLLIGVILATSGAILGFTASFLVSRRWVARATLEGAEASASRRALEKESLTPMILQSLSFRPKLDFTPMDELIEQIRENCAFSAPAPNRLTMEFTDDDRDAALEFGNALLHRLSDLAPGAHVTEPLRVTETGPTRALFTGAGLAAGLLLAAIAWLGFRRQTVSQ